MARHTQRAQVVHITQPAALQGSAARTGLTVKTVTTGSVGNSSSAAYSLKQDKRTCATPPTPKTTACRPATHLVHRHNVVGLPGMPLHRSPDQQVQVGAVAAGLGGGARVGGGRGGIQDSGWVGWCRDAQGAAAVAEGPGVFAGGGRTSSLGQCCATMRRRAASQPRVPFSTACSRFTRAWQSRRHSTHTPRSSANSARRHAEPLLLRAYQPSQSPLRGAQRVGSAGAGRGCVGGGKARPENTQYDRSTGT